MTPKGLKLSPGEVRLKWALWIIVYLTPLWAFLCCGVCK